MDAEQWIVIATDQERHRLTRGAEKLRRAYPGKYDIRITQDQLLRRFALAVKHREPSESG